MRISAVQPPPPPREIAMTFPVDEGWAITAALVDYARNHPYAADRDKWTAWAKELDKELRR